MTSADTVRSLRRYPVKSMGGEPLASAILDERGLVGDRWFAVEDADGRFASGKSSQRMRRRDQVFAYSAQTMAEGVVVRGPDGSWPVGSTELDAVLTRVMGESVRVTPERVVSHFDGASVSIIGTASLSWCAERWGVDADPRRLRANIVVETTEPFVEETWIARRLIIGSAVLEVQRRIPRCRMIELAQDGVSTPEPWLRHVAEERDLDLAVYARVVTPGEIRVGDLVAVSPSG